MSFFVFDCKLITSRSLQLKWMVQLWIELKLNSNRNWPRKFLVNKFLSTWIWFCNREPDQMVRRKLLKCLKLESNYWAPKRKVWIQIISSSHSNDFWATRAEVRQQRRSNRDVLTNFQVERFLSLKESVQYELFAHMSKWSFKRSIAPIGEGAGSSHWENLKERQQVKTFTAKLYMMNSHVRLCHIVCCGDGLLWHSLLRH